MKPGARLYRLLGSCSRSSSLGRGLASKLGTQAHNPMHVICMQKGSTSSVAVSSMAAAQHSLLTQSGPCPSDRFSVAAHKPQSCVYSNSIVTMPPAKVSPADADSADSEQVRKDAVI